MCAWKIHNISLERRVISPPGSSPHPEHWRRGFNEQWLSLLSYSLAQNWSQRDNFDPKSKHYTTFLLVKDLKNHTKESNEAARLCWIYLLWTSVWHGRHISAFRHDPRLRLMGTFMLLNQKTFSILLHSGVPPANLEVIIEASVDPEGLAVYAWSCKVNPGRVGAGVGLSACIQRMLRAESGHVQELGAVELSLHFWGFFFKNIPTGERKRNCGYATVSLCPLANSKPIWH